MRITCHLLLCFGSTLAFGFESQAQDRADENLTAVYSPAQGIGPQVGIMRRDPSDIIKVGDLYYVWYSKGAQAHGYDATVWYATSPDGHIWKEKGELIQHLYAERMSSLEELLWSQ